MSKPPTATAPRAPRAKGSWRFLFRSDSVALNLVSTVAANKDRGKGLDRLTEPALLERWFREACLPDLAGPVSPADLEQARELREAIFRLADHRLTGRAIDAGDLALLNRHAACAMPPVRIGPDGFSAVLPDSASVAELLGILARDAIDVFTGPFGDRVRQCASAKCAVIFVDRSRTGNRRWCAMSPCGDKANARAYRQRRKEGAG